jgi:GntR family transcriptional regulator
MPPALLRRLPRTTAKRDGAASGPGARVKRGKLPLYVQCAGLLRHCIENGDWPIGQRLPSLESIAAQTGVAVVTVRQAVEMLEGEGLLERRQGAGTFVVGKSGPRDWLELGTRWDSLLKALSDVTVQVINVRLDHLVPRLEAGEGVAASGYRFLSRLHSRGRHPFCVIRLYLADDIHRIAPRRFDKELVLPVLTELAGDRIARAWQTVTVGKADPTSAEQLGIDAGDPVAYVRRLVTDWTDTVIYVAEITYRADVVRLEIDLIDSGSDPPAAQAPTATQASKTTATGRRRAAPSKEIRDEHA